MFGIPRSPYGAAKKVARYVRGSGPRPRQTEGWLDYFSRSLDLVIRPAVSPTLAAERKAFYEEHGYYPPAVR
jgi:hypothetical protein